MASAPKNSLRHARATYEKDKYPTSVLVLTLEAAQYYSKNYVMLLQEEA